MSHIFIKVPIDFVDEMIDKANYAMLGAFCEYVRDVQKNRVYPEREYAMQWFKDRAKKSTARNWIVKFKAIFEAFRISTLKFKCDQNVTKDRPKCDQEFEATRDFQGGEVTKDRPKGDQNVTDNKEERVKKKDLSKSTANATNLVVEYLEKNPSISKDGKYIIERFVNYRKKIKHPLKTIAPIEMYLKILREAYSKGYKIESVIELMESREWQTVKMEWIAKEIPLHAENEKLGGWR